MIWIIIAAIVLFFGGFVFSLFYAHKKAFYSDRKHKYDPHRSLSRHPDDPTVELRRQKIDEMLALDAERVFITARDGLRLSARYRHLHDGAPVVIMCHGFRSSADSDFAGLADICFSAGYNTLLIDQRAHGESEGSVISYGIRERWDVIEWIKYINERFGEKTPIILYGVSMGAATVLMASGEELPSNVLGVIADCPYSSPYDIIVKVGGSRLAGWLVCIGARLHGFSMSSASPVEAVKKTKLPILLLHGDEDRFVPYYMSEKIAKANPDIRFETIHSKKHARSYFDEPEKYTSCVRGFITRVIENNESNGDIK
ncbi:MAG: alpha/beta fold hydrolase [Clostridia bacterium]|nr:alpha/beta fold hydrolase [Clostridia bacterium]